MFPQGKGDILTMNAKAIFSQTCTIGKAFWKWMSGNVPVINDLWLKTLGFIYQNSELHTWKAWKLVLVAFEISPKGGVSAGLHAFVKNIETQHLWLFCIMRNGNLLAEFQQDFCIIYEWGWKVGVVIQRVPPAMNLFGGTFSATERSEWIKIRHLSYCIPKYQIKIGEIKTHGDFIENMTSNDTFIRTRGFLGS